jgi:hypothetical protein
MFLFDMNAAMSFANCDISIPGLLGVSAMYILYSNGARTAPWGTSARAGFHSEDFPSIMTLNLRSVRYAARRRKLESGIPVTCSL